MRRAFRLTLALLTKRPHDYLRLPWCQGLLGGTEVAVAPEKLVLALLVKEAALERIVVLPLNAFGPALPHNTQGRPLYQHHLVSYFSSQPQHTQQEGPDISLLDPALQKQWDHARNAHLGNIVIRALSGQQAWWWCKNCPDGHLHSWSAVVRDRSNGNGCPQCSGRKVCKHNSLVTKAPEVAAQWDYKANSGTPESVVAHSSQICSWCCDVCGHKWSSAPMSRVRKDNVYGCPVCAMSKRRIRHPTFAECNHPLLAEWDYIRNAAQGDNPDSVRLRSNKHIFWLCIKCPAGQEHSWSASPLNRTSCNKTGCPFCAGRAACKCNSLQALYPDIAAEWDHSKNTDKPSAVPAHSVHSAWWCNSERGSWQQPIQSRVIGQQRRIARLARNRQNQSFAGNPK